MSTYTKEILKEIFDNNPLRRGFILDLHDEMVSFMMGEADDIRRLTYRLAHDIKELFELDDCEVMPIGVCPDGKISWALVRILANNNGHQLSLSIPL